MRAFFAGFGLLVSLSMASPVSACEGVTTSVSGESQCLKFTAPFKDCPDCPDMLLLPAGFFTMGSATVSKTTLDEAPAHRVILSKPFAVGKFEITRGQFSTFVKESGYKPQRSFKSCTTVSAAGFGKVDGKSWEDPGFPQDDTHPAVCVDWKAATAYAKWLSRKTGSPYRLLTESEWEYAARAGSDGEYSFEPRLTDICDHMNLADQRAQKTPALLANYRRFGMAPQTCDDGYAYTAPIGTYEANGLGLHDMHGNVREWVVDCYAPDYTKTPIDGSAQQGAKNCKRVFRGGGWFWTAVEARAAKRRNSPGMLADDLGFRVARDVE